jgi:hypothetical protein
MQAGNLFTPRQIEPQIRDAALAVRLSPVNHSFGREVIARISFRIG